MIKIHLVLHRTRQLGSSSCLSSGWAPAVVGCRASSLTEVVFTVFGSLAGYRVVA